MMRIVLVASLALTLTPASRSVAAATTCDDVTPCTVEGQVCRASTGTCVFQVFDADEALAGQQLIAAVTRANADAAPDIIFIGEVNPADPNNLPFVQPRLNDPIVDATLGNLALPPVVAPLTIEGPDADLAVINLNEDNGMRAFVLRPDAVLDVKPTLSLRRVTVRDGRAGGQGVGGTAVHVTALATTTGELPAFTCDNAQFRGNRNGAAPVFNEGDPLSITACIFEQNFGQSAGGVASVRGAAIANGAFRDNESDNAGAIDAQSATFVDGAGVTRNATLSAAGVVFERNRGGHAGAVRSLATTTSLNSDYRDNVSGEFGGAIVARNLSVQGGLFSANFSVAGGGAIAFLDDPVSTPAFISGAAFTRNVSQGDGGAMLVTVASTIVDNLFDSNTSSASGGATAFRGVPDATLLERNAFRFNQARVTVTLSASDTTLDERGGDTGSMSISMLSTGSAMFFDATNNVEAHDNCIFANTANVVAGINGTSGVDLSANWWGAANGPAPGGDGDRPVAIPQIDVSSPLTEAPASCLGVAQGAYPLIFVDVTVDEADALIVSDYRLLNSLNGISVLNSGASQIRPDTRTGVLDVDVIGVNDDETEGAESFTFTILDCNDGAACEYRTSGNTSASFSISDNGDGVIGEGEGEGEACEEDVAVSTTTLLLPNTGAASIATLTVTNNSPCGIVLFAPFVQAGASQGFSVKPLPPDQRALASGASVDITVQYTPPEEATGEPPEGVLQIETDGGTLIQIALGLEGGCSCRSTPRGPPFAAVLLGLALIALRRRSQR